VVNPGFNANSATTSPTGWSTYSANVPETDLDGLAAKFGKPVQAVPNGRGLGAFYWSPPGPW
jgi:arabinogalactan endo-1,4-beta-galactosidase